MNLKELLQHFIDHRHKVIVRRTQFDLDAAAGAGAHPRGPQDRGRQHRRGHQDHPEARRTRREADARLRKRFGFSEKQSDAILNMRLAKLTGLEIEKLEAELKEVRATIKELKGILASKPKRMAILKEEMDEVASTSATTAGPRSWPTRASSRSRT